MYANVVLKSKRVNCGRVTPGNFSNNPVRHLHIVFTFRKWQKKAKNIISNEGS